MRTRMFALIALTGGLGLPAGAADKPQYQPFASSAGRYKILFPGPVKTETREVKTDRGALKVTLDSVEFGDDVTFVVTHVDYPDEVAKADPVKRLDKVRDGSRGPDGKVVAEKALTVGPDRLPAREVVIEKPDVVLRNRIVLAGARMYQVMVEGPKGFVLSKDADRFFDSFEVTR